MNSFTKTLRHRYFRDTIGDFMKEATFVKSIKSIEEEQVRDGYLQREKSEVKWFLKETSCPLTGGFTKQEMKDMVART